MKAIGVISTAALSLLLGIAAPASAQHEQRDEKQDHPAQQQDKQKQAKPEQQHAKQQQQSQHAQQPQKQGQNKQTPQHAQQPQKQEQNRQTQQHAQQQRGNQHPQRTQEQQRVSTAHGNSIAPTTGSQTTAVGSNVAATTATASLTTVSVDTLVRTMGSASTACPSWWLAGIRASSIGAIGSVSLTHGRNTGGMTGMTTTTFTSPTSTMAITFTTADIPASELRSASRCSGVRGAASGKAAPLMNTRQGANHARNHIDRNPGVSTSRGSAPMVA